MMLVCIIHDCLIDNSYGVCPLENAKINELSDVRAQIPNEKDFYKSHPHGEKSLKFNPLREVRTIAVVG